MCIKPSVKILMPLLYASLLTAYTIYIVIELWNTQYYIIKNLTAFEYRNLYSLIYLWKSMDKSYFNPFDKGVCRNIIEAIVPMFGCRKTKITVELNQTSDLESQSRPHLVYTGKEIVNWWTMKIYTLQDIENSPMKQVYEEFIKQKRERKNKKLKKLESAKQE